MKHQFMNKENGKTARVLVMFLDDRGLMQTDVYDTVEDLLADYGAYEAQTCEPLIKDEKIRKAVRAWAEACGVEEYVSVSDLSPAFTRFYTNEYEIDIKTENSLCLSEREYYTIAELCGEEEE